MAATLDDLLAMAAAIRVDLRGLRQDMKKPGGSAGSSTPPTPASPAAGTFWTGLTSGLGKVVGILGAVNNALASFGGQLTGFVSKANPAAVQRFRLALDDLQAVIGRALTPVLERVTLLIRKMGDAFVSLSPSAQRLVGGLAGGIGLGAALTAVSVAVKAAVAALGPLPVIAGMLASAFTGVAFSMASGQQISEAFKGVLKALGNVIETVAKVVVPAVAGVLVPAFNTLAKILSAVGNNVVVLAAVSLGVARALGVLTISVAGLGAAAKFAAKAFVIGIALEVLAPLLEKLADALKWVTEVVGDALEAIGLGGSSDYNPEKESSVGAAVRQAQIGDISSYANRAYASAYQGSTTDIPQKSLEELKGIHAQLKKQGRMPDGSRREDRTLAGSSALGRAIHPFDRGTDGKTNFARGLDNVRDRLGRLFG